MFIYLWQTWQTCIKTKICEHAFMFFLYIEREREFQPLRTMGLWAAILWYGECSLMLTYRLPVPGVPGEKGGNNVDQWHTQSGLAIDFCEGNIFQRWMAWWAVDANMLRQFCASKKKKKTKKKHQVCSYWVLIPWQFQDVGPHYVYTSIYFCHMCRQAESLWLTTALGIAGPGPTISFGCYLSFWELAVLYSISF